MYEKACKRIVKLAGYRVRFLFIQETLCCSVVIIKVEVSPRCDTNEHVTCNHSLGNSQKCSDAQYRNTPFAVIGKTSDDFGQIFVGAMTIGLTPACSNLWWCMLAWLARQTH